MFQSRSIRATDNKYNPVWKSIDWLEKFYQEGGREKEEEGEREEYSYFNFRDRVKERIRRIEGIPSPLPSIEASYVRVLARLGYQRPLSLSLSLYPFSYPDSFVSFPFDSRCSPRIDNTIGVTIHNPPFPTTDLATVLCCRASVLNRKERARGRREKEGVPANQYVYIR